METQDINNFNAKISKIEENLRTINDGTKNIAFRLTAYSGLFFNASRLQTSARALSDTLISNKYDSTADTREKREYTRRQYQDMVKGHFNTELGNYTEKSRNMDPQDQTLLKVGIDNMNSIVGEIDALCDIRIDLQYAQIISKLEDLARRSEPLIGIAKTKMDLISDELYELGEKLK